MSLAETAQRLINLHGRSVTLYLGDVTPTDTDKPWRGARTTPGTNPGQTVGPLKAVFVSNTEGELARSLYAALTGGTGVPPRRGRDSFLVAGLDLGATDPKTIDAVVDGGDEWRVTGLDIIKPGDVLYAITLEVRQ